MHAGEKGFKVGATMGLGLALLGAVARGTPAPGTPPSVRLALAPAVCAVLGAAATGLHAGSTLHQKARTTGNDGLRERLQRAHIETSLQQQAYFGHNFLFHLAFAVVNWQVPAPGLPKALVPLCLLSYAAGLDALIGPKSGMAPSELCFVPGNQQGPNIV
ncbi:hypothetical protein GPECTOR_10g938 [Gonium pectorale]|uniref:Uncharacterized protein n=1 Tax=Gonium pectorale TaxID=33097 RepID=A0A150GR07_GONPE|nr:hypothetical protein GPECTOR_10g938 [Gonium pectorale]|eukprot:KXZ52306.1 hypothetical protein GPECTOR_10g938 [Gonium pectorale]